MRASYFFPAAVEEVCIYESKRRGGKKGKTANRHRIPIAKKCAKVGGKPEAISWVRVK